MIQSQKKTKKRTRCWKRYVIICSNRADNANCPKMHKFNIRLPCIICVINNADKNVLLFEYQNVVSNYAKTPASAVLALLCSIWPMVSGLYPQGRALAVTTNDLRTKFEFQTKAQLSSPTSNSLEFVENYMF